VRQGDFNLVAFRHMMQENIDIHQKHLLNIFLINYFKEIGTSS
jgi:hypothetical protein